MDISPTIFRELGIDDDTIRFDGEPTQDGNTDRTLYSEEIAYGYDQQAVMNSEYHLIHSPHENETVLLDRVSDRILNDSGDIVDEMVENTIFEREYGEKTSIDDDIKERLE